MKFPKNKSNVFHVARYNYEGNGDLRFAANCGTFANISDADDFRGACEQEWRDKLGDDANVLFRVEMGTFYG
jgi:hypothetical protein